MSSLKITFKNISWLMLIFISSIILSTSSTVLAVQLGIYLADKISTSILITCVIGSYIVYKISLSEIKKAVLEIKKEISEDDG